MICINMTITLFIEHHESPIPLFYHGCGSCNHVLIDSGGTNKMLATHDNFHQILALGHQVNRCVYITRLAAIFFIVNF